MSYMIAASVTYYFQENGLKGSFLDDLQIVDGFTVIPTSAIKVQIGDEAFRKMECEVATYSEYNTYKIK